MYYSSTLKQGSGDGFGRKLNTRIKFAAQLNPTGRLFGAYFGFVGTALFPTSQPTHLEEDVSTIRQLAFRSFTGHDGDSGKNGRRTETAQRRGGVGPPGSSTLSLEERKSTARAARAGEISVGVCRMIRGLAYKAAMKSEIGAE
ncbi:hypothetical protein R3P38DRAFT_2757465 [Favolaschia claudopus]|uniref:Uncharacterized protein n=1 Tax=Favolaschia claudopus TaxID=2862362 RepID=A0AAW0ELA1_9AGAR